MDFLKERKKERLGSSLQKIAADFFSRRFQNEAFISVLRVDLKENLEEAKLFISIYPVEKKDEVMKKIRVILPELKKEAVHKLRIRSIPKLSVSETSLDKEEKLERLFDEVKE